jgi:hypothetical protein
MNLQSGWLFLKKHSLSVLALVIIAVLLTPILFSGLYSDDLMNFQYLRSIPDFTFQKMLDYANTEIDSVLETGRYTPVSFYLLSFMHWLPETVFQYKLLVYIGNLIAVASFVFFLHEAQLTNYIGIALLFYATVIQFQVGYHDCFTSLNAMYPVATSCSLLAVALYMDVIQKSNWFKWVGAIVFACLSLLITEVGTVTFLIIIAITVLNYKVLQKRIALALPFMLLPVLYFGYLKSVREHITINYSGVKTSFNAYGMFKVFVCQVFSTLPLSNFYKLYAIPQLFVEQLKDPLVVLGCLILLVLIIFFFLRFEHEKSSWTKPRLDQLSTGVLYWFIPAMILMFSAKYQDELRLGFAYLPLYFQNFGLVIIITTVYAFLAERWKGKTASIKWLAAPLFAVIIICSYLLNCCMVNARNQDQSVPAGYFYQSIKTGILNPATDNSVLVLGSDFFYQQANKYRMIFYNVSGKHFEVIEQNDFDWTKVSPDKAVYRLYYDTEKGLSQLFKMDKTTGAFTKINEMPYPPAKAVTYAEMRTIRKMFF